MWKDIFSNPKNDDEEAESMLDDFKRPRAARVEEDGPSTAIGDSPPVNSFLDRGTEFDGKLAFEGAVRINGRFSGEIFSEGTLYIGEGGSVNAAIQVDTIIISGEVTGDVKAISKVELQSAGRLRGNIRTHVLKIEEGALFEGNCSMQPEEAPASKAKPEVEAPPPEPHVHEGLELS
jgi:cytoskeletal protein CcmA (bactofilin family)